MSLVEFSELIVKRLVKEPDLVKVQEFESDNDKTIEILVAEADMGKVIGRQGRVAKSIRTVMKSVSAKEGKRANIEFVD